MDRNDGRTKYVLRGEGAGSVFVIDEKTGNIHVTKPLDREEKDEYRLIATSTDRQTDRALEPSSQFIIRVQDINDNPPIFDDGPYIATVPEMANIAPREKPAAPYRADTRGAERGRSYERRILQPSVKLLVKVKEKLLPRPLRVHLFPSSSSGRHADAARRLAVYHVSVCTSFTPRVNVNASVDPPHDSSRSSSSLKATRQRSDRSRWAHHRKDVMSSKKQQQDEAAPSRSIPLFDLTGDLSHDAESQLRPLPRPPGLGVLPSTPMPLLSGGGRSRIHPPVPASYVVTPACSGSPFQGAEKPSEEKRCQRGNVFRMKEFSHHDQRISGFLGAAALKRIKKACACN
ncbi:Cadherin-24 [Liparis tanakae]|uniref:Cadherin-24 n=1 Tax=Liparis tanakae TaxID=230148 RepID=A0A4Z2FGW3_9TELE|nr:Cadherin-24 [Liparis tanakae]